MLCGEILSTCCFGLGLDDGGSFSFIEPVSEVLFKKWSFCPLTHTGNIGPGRITFSLDELLQKKSIISQKLLDAWTYHCILESCLLFLLGCFFPKPSKNATTTSINNEGILTNSGILSQCTDQAHIHRHTTFESRSSTFRGYLPTSVISSSPLASLTLQTMSFF